MSDTLSAARSDACGKSERIKRLSEELEEVLAQATETYVDLERLDTVLAALRDLDPLDPRDFDPQEGLRRFREICP